MFTTGSESRLEQAKMPQVTGSAGGWGVSGKNPSRFVPANSAVKIVSHVAQQILEIPESEYGHLSEHETWRNAC